MRLIAAALAFALVGGQATAQAPVPGACVTSPEEKALTKQTLTRMARRPDLSPVFTQAHIAEGCGVWRVTVTPAGNVTKLELIRRQSKDGYEPALRRPLMKTTFQPLASEWIGMMNITIKLPD